MANTNEVSLLQYARFHGIATEHTDIDLLQHIDDICDIPPDFLHPLGDTFSVIEQTIASSQQVIEQNLHSGKLDIRKESVQFLSSVLRDIKRDNIDDRWDEVLPLWDRYDDLKLEPPLFSSDNDTNLVLPAEPLRYSREENLLCSHEGLASDYDSNFLSPLIHEADIIEKRVGNEKLDCSKDALLLIQGVRQAGNRPLDLDDLLCPLVDVAEEDRFHPQSPPLLPLDDDCFSCDSPPLSSSYHLLLGPVRHDSAEVPTDIDTVHYEGCSRTENVPGSTISILESEFEDQVFEGIDRQLSHDPSLSRSSPNERGPPDGMSPADMDITNEKGFASDFEQVIMAVTIPRSPSSITSRVTYTEITDNIATSDLFPYNNCIVQDLPSRASYSPIPSACSSSHQEPYVQEFPDCSAESIIETPVPELYLITPTIEDDPSVASCLPEALPQLYDNISPSNPSLLRKRKLDNTKEDNNKTDSANHKAKSPIVMGKTPSTKHLTTSLGSLSRFMETRGQASIPEEATQSHYFINNKSTETTGKEHDVSLRAQTSDNHPIDTPARRQSEIVSFNHSPIPCCLPQENGPIILSLSTSLLRTHLRIVQCIERMNPATSIIYREYGAESWKLASGSYIQSRNTVPSNYNDEADIIIPPSTAIVLTTSQATTQLFLPGHKSTIVGDIPSVNSPLRERVLGLARKYENIYVLISHCSGTTSNFPYNGFTIDKIMLSSLIGFTAFCSSMSNLNVYPVVLPSSPDTIAGWILALAGKSVNSHD
ncbi:hypothetical protein BO83DRAFT_346874 [Aspergillus eucalypticola CBS 122712]|uniref:DUF7102 domain-containing protein n=1 Tax=Aspergillus eucalypticola (strain CBS 122712 / IBT 29274) TaxID=1448314 RepID=A0A317USI4_ASPEC|nr:uncharacterized protein BO83DRAFT_346874 [Aspergillus eucalypticola CBS 122712]PWY64236.1 hypothetical protein BO83DRAFT_346874 [Aspergillus eucalypticola CBS 122712]